MWGCMYVCSSHCWAGLHAVDRCRPQDPPQGPSEPSPETNVIDARVQKKIRKLMCIYPAIKYATATVVAVICCSTHTDCNPPTLQWQLHHRWLGSWGINLRPPILESGNSPDQVLSEVRAACKTFGEEQHFEGLNSCFLQNLRPASPTTLKIFSLAANIVLLKCESIDLGSL